VKRRRPRETGRTWRDIAAAVFPLLGTAPRGVVAAYYVGAVPFVLGLLYFWSDMSRGAFADRRCFAASLGMAVLFVWMKSWQAVFAHGLLRHTQAASPRAWTPRRLIRLVALQTAVQPHGVLLIPAALFLMLPFYSVHAFFQNVTAAADGDGRPLRAVVSRAWRQALLWPRQNHLLIWLLSPWVLGVGMLTLFGVSALLVSFSPEAYAFEGTLWFVLALLFAFQLLVPLAPFGSVVAGNLAILLVSLPNLLHSLLGIETAFTLSGLHGIFNTTFLLTVLALSYLCLDPLMKAAYVLRCFYADSLKTGSDLLLDLGQTTAGDDRS
jgi:hypothetical protein